MKGTSSKAPSGILLDAPTQGPRGILEIRWITRNLYDLSKAYFAVTFLSSSPTCPATQCGLPQLRCEWSRHCPFIGESWNASANINLLASLLVHAQYQGYWSQLGLQFEEEMEALLERHVLKGLIDAPWVRTDDPESGDDDGFFAALQELAAYAFEESVRIKKKGSLFPRWHEKPVRSSYGILQEVLSLLQKYRSELVRQSRLLDQGDPA